MRLKSRFVTLLVAAVGVIALFALTASAALAEVHWNVTNNETHWKGTLTVEKEGKSASCPNLDMRVPVVNNASNHGIAYLSVGTMVFYMELPCSGGTELWLFREGEAFFNGTNYEIKFYIGKSGIYLLSPLGEYFDNPFIFTESAIVTNGSKETPSKITFSKSEIGGGFGEPVTTISGTLTMTTSSGGLLTLSK